MILKALTRTDTGAFRQLVNYVLRDGVGECPVYLHHMPGVDSLKPEQISEAFRRCDRQRRKRKGGVCLNHTIISFDPSVKEQCTPHKMYAVMARYIELRCPNSVAIGVIHLDKENRHFHVLHSAVDEEGRSTRISKMAFKRCKEALSAFQQEMYPELSPPQRERTSMAVVDELSEAFQKIIERTNSYEHCIELLQAQEMILYSRRGKLTGIIHNGKKYRFSRLIDSPEHVQVLEILQQEYQLSKELDYLSEQRNKEKITRER